MKGEIITLDFTKVLIESVNSISYIRQTDMIELLVIIVSIKFLLEGRVVQIMIKYFVNQVVNAGIPQEAKTLI